MAFIHTDSGRMLAGTIMVPSRVTVRPFGSKERETLLVKERRMTAYLVIDITILDHEAMEEYEANVLPLLETYGGRPIAYDDAALVLEGAWHNRILIVQFPSKEDAKTLFDSPEYAPWKLVRRRSSEGRAVAIQAVA